MIRKVRWPDLLWIAAAVLLSVRLSFRWLEINRLPFGSFLLFLSLQHGELIRNGDLQGLLRQFFAPGYYPPLYECALGLLHALFGFSRTNAVILNGLALAVAAVSCYGMGVFIAGRRAGITAALFFLLYPGIFLWTRTPMSELALTGPAALCIWMLYRSDRFKNRRAALAFSLSFAIGMYIKWSLFPALVCPILLFLIWIVAAGMKEGVAVARLGLDRDQWINLTLSGAGIFVLLAPWYLGSLQWEWIGKATHTEPVKTFGIFHWVWYYASLLKTNSLRLPFFICLLAALPAGFVLPHRKRQVLVAAWLLGGYFLFTLIPHKEPRYLLPLLPAAAVISASGLEFLKINWLKIAASALLVAGGAFHFFFLSFLDPRLPHPTGNDQNAVSPVCQQAPQEEFDRMVALIQTHAGGKEPIQLAIHPFNHAGALWNDEMIYYYLEVRKFRKKGPKIDMPGYSPLMYDMFYSELGRIDFLLADQGLFSAGPQWLNGQVAVWRENETLHEKNLDVPADDPGLIRRIEAEFSTLGTIESGCFPSMRIMKRRGN